MKQLTADTPIVIDGISINPIDYAIRANADLGIKETGKSYAATWFAEQLMKRGIPIVAISPSPGRVWRYLKVGRPGFDGFPVVIVGENADLPLSPDTAGSIMRAAMQEGISVVFDIFSKSLSKADWRKIVTEVFNVLLFENEDYGLRHAFLEESEEYIPQRIYDNVTYSAVEKFIRMGGNSRVGVTLINPRAEGVNKQALELCESLLLFKQTGRNSIANLEKWLKSVDADNQQEIVKSLSSLQKGQCWFWDGASSGPVLIQIPEKDTVHPDRRNLSGSSGAVSIPGIDVTTFVERMNKALAKQKPAPKTSEGITKKGVGHLKIEERRDNTLVIQLREENQRQAEKIEELTADLRIANRTIFERDRQLETVREMLRPDYERMQEIFGELGNGGSGPVSGADPSKYAHWFPKLVGYQKDMLKAFIDNRRLTRDRLGLIIGKKVKGNGTFGDYVTALKNKGLIYEEGNELVLVEL